MTARFERKYRVGPEARAYLRALWGAHLRRAPFTDAAGSYPVLSQYFDSPDLVMYRDKLAGVGSRCKVRLRTYGYRFEPARLCFLEIKQRTGDSVAKLRVRLPAFDPDLLVPDRWERSGAAGLAPLLALRARHRLRPTAQVLYLREAHEAADDPFLRITFDSLITALHPGEVAGRGILCERGRAALGPREVVLEIKGRDRLPAWVRRGIYWAEVHQEPVPKYALAMDRLRLPAIGAQGFA